MALSQADRIAISKKLVNIPRENASADSTKDQLAAQKAEVKTQDDANRGLVEAENPLINLYQQEIERYDGNGRTELAEQDFLDSADRLLNNPFFPNDPNTPLPSLPDGLWTGFVPFSQTKAIGKNNNETYNSVTREQDLIDAVNAAIAAVEVFSDPTRSTGDECNESGTCSMPAYDNETDCLNNGGTWTPGPDLIEPSTDMQNAGTDLINAVQAWEDFINGTIAVVPTTDTDAGRAAENTASIDDANNAIAEIDSWQAIQDYASHSQTTCVGFNGLDVNTLAQSKFRADALQILKDEITARQAFIATRVGQISGHLGGVNQNYSTGDINSVTGFYGKRFRFIDLRLNVIGGTLAKLKGFERGEDAQDKFKQANANASAAYASILQAVAFRSPGTNTNSIHVLDATGFSVSDSVFIVSDTQSEISATITQIDGNRVVLDKPIPEKYRHTELARLYKEL